MWNDILQSLNERDILEKKDSEYYAAFAQLAQQLQAVGLESTSPSPSPSLTTSGEYNREPDLAKENHQLKAEITKLIEGINEKTIAAEKAELRASQAAKAKTSLEKQIDKLNTKIETLTAQLKEKDRSIEIINDEALLNQIQSNVLKDEIEKVRHENESLIKRWMAKVREDAERLNEENAKAG
ncbi:autophagy protein 16 [Suhomyces tanzawaensis NRRL Y-17324]|uniref:Autophagy protein 16 n=1 Tax=Suhomyces tanzawaensis NRRL Y-17324 TaxID=984487 RepID=A0A1E4SGW6_9ASCO|nr:autophagy protein 16 [Suhomyces tanzawaensis NRRL Y-17324]ODV78759.1 autophagy protein 16 [Suhomyces tanzawaensis NRRL Y-17324]